MAALWLIGLFLASALILNTGITLWLLSRNRSVDEAAPPRGRIVKGRAAQNPLSALELSSGFVPRGKVRIHGDVVVRAPPQASGPKRATEIDVPTGEVDGLLEALRSAGFDARDTGITVDTDDGEEALTTIALGLENLRPVGSRSADDVLVVDGRLLARRGARLWCSVQAKGDVTLEDDVFVDGSIESQKEIRVGQDCRIRGYLQSGGDVHLGPSCRAHAVVAGRDVHLSDADRESLQGIRARRIHIRATEAGEF